MKSVPLRCGVDVIPGCKGTPGPECFTSLLRKLMFIFEFWEHCF